MTGKAVAASAFSFVAESTSVEARFDERGTVTPLSFTWRDRRRPITAVGRRWVDEIEGRTVLHILVMSPSDAVFELCFDLQAHRWEVRRAWERPIIT